MEDRAQIAAASANLRNAKRARRVEICLSLEHFGSSQPSFISDLQIGGDHEHTAHTSGSRERRQSLNQQRTRKLNAPCAQRRCETLLRGAQRLDGHNGPSLEAM